MAYSESCRDKLSQYSMGCPSKPFIDENLQLQLPERAPQQDQTSRFHSPIYSHYMGSVSSSYLSLPVNETELYHIMREAEQSYAAWKQMQGKLKDAANRV
jgi:hypothetical protein